MIKVVIEGGGVEAWHGARLEVARDGTLEVIAAAAERGSGFIYPAGSWERVSHEEDAP